MNLGVWRTLTATVKAKSVGPLGHILTFPHSPSMLIHTVLTPLACANGGGDWGAGGLCPHLPAHYPHLGIQGNWDFGNVPPPTPKILCTPLTNTDSTKKRNIETGGDKRSYHF